MLNIFYRIVLYRRGTGNSRLHFSGSLRPDFSNISPKRLGLLRASCTAMNYAAGSNGFMVY